MDFALWTSALLLVLFLASLGANWRLLVSERKREALIQKERESSARQLYEILILKELSERVGYSLDTEEILGIITSSLRQFMDYTAVGFVVLHPEKVKLKVHFDKSANHQFFLEMKDKMLSSIKALGGAIGPKTNIEESISGAIEIESGVPKVGSFFNIPLVVGGELKGVLTVAHEKTGLYKEADMTILYKITSRAAEALLSLQNVVKREQERVNKVREEYTSIIVHELRSPLDGIRKINELILSGKLSKQELKEYATMAYQSSGRMMELINDILDLSKIQAGKFEIHKTEANIKEVIENRVLFYKASAEMAKIQISTFFDPSLEEKSFFDREAIKQVIGNFISNALKFTSPGGKIVVSAFLQKPDKSLPEGFLKIDMPVLPKQGDLNPPTASICVVVSDNGSGISNQVLPNLFKTYSQGQLPTLSDRPKGTGLGLSIVKGLVEAHKGKTGVVSKDGFGSSFFFTIPL